VDAVEVEKALKEAVEDYLSEVPVAFVEVDEEEQNLASILFVFPENFLSWNEILKKE
jgi:hypothetical protein